MKNELKIKEKKIKYLKEQFLDCKEILKDNIKRADRFSNLAILTFYDTYKLAVSILNRLSKINFDNFVETNEKFLWNIKSKQDKFVVDTLIFNLENGTIKI